MERSHAGKTMDPRLEEIFRKYSAMIFRLCLRYTKSREEAEDLTQEVFLKIGRRLGEFRGDSQLTTWIYRIGVNTCLDHLKAKKRDGLLKSDYFEAGNSGPPVSVSERILAKVDVERILELEKPEYRQLLFLTFAEGLTYEETAKVLGKTKAAVAKIVSRFRDRNTKAKRNGWMTSTGGKDVSGRA